MRRGNGFFVDEAAEGIGWPRVLEDAWADIALVFHWPASELDHMTIRDVMEWRERAVERWNRIHAPPPS
ncbi:GpE family phage tail protein [Brevundimonas naejangsanensis]|uniref:GpE family phage tail protein n=1 Tax=Brevundimonas naejangsanensis TaxID=588932 RepID=UPI0039F6A161